VVALLIIGKLMPLNKQALHSTALQSPEGTSLLIFFFFFCHMADSNARKPLIHASRPQAPCFATLQVPEGLLSHNGQKTSAPQHTQSQTTG
jgi:hypothetical protein